MTGRTHFLKYWIGIKPEDDSKSVNLFPWVGKDWVIVGSKTSTAGTVQAALSRVEILLGFSMKLKIHSPRAWFATCAHQLLYPREDREKLGRWDPGSLMPDLYDRSACATELRLRGEILERIRKGVWKPTNAFETPSQEKTIKKKPSRHRLVRHRNVLPMKISLTFGERAALSTKTVQKDSCETTFPDDWGNGSKFFAGIMFFTFY